MLERRYATMNDKRDFWTSPLLLSPLSGVMGWWITNPSPRYNWSEWFWIRR